MNVLVVDNGARGHALTDKVAQTRHCNQLWAPSVSPGILRVARTAIDPAGELLETNNVNGLVEFAKRERIGLTLVGQEEPLALGIVDAFEAEGLNIFGPSAAATEIETSREFTTQITDEFGIPTAKRKILEDYSQIIEYAQNEGFPIVLKANGPAQGKGARICPDLATLKIELEDFRLSSHYGQPGQKVLLEEYLEGPEISLHAWCDGEAYRMFPFAMQDHKTLHENDEGPMTGGIGVISPVPGITEDDIGRLGRAFVAPVLQALRDMGRPFKGVLYPGVKLTKDGPKLLEYNARPGGPETEAFIPRLDTDLLSIASACIEGRLSEIPEIRWRRVATACIVLTAKGYPKNTEKGAVINGLKELRNRPGIQVYHGATKLRDDGEIVVDGGRVLSVVAVGQRAEKLQNVINRGYEAAGRIRFDDEPPHFRRDIGKTALSKEFLERMAIARRSLPN